MGSRGSGYGDGVKNNVSLNKNGLTEKEQRRANRLAKKIQDFWWTYGTPTALTEEQQKDYTKKFNEEQDALYELAWMADAIEPHSMDALLHTKIYTSEDQVVRAMKDLQKMLNVDFTATRGKKK